MSRTTAATCRYYSSKLESLEVTLLLVKMFRSTPTAICVLAAAMKTNGTPPGGPQMSTNNDYCLVIFLLSGDYLYYEYSRVSMQHHFILLLSPISFAAISGVIFAALVTCSEQEESNSDKKITKKIEASQCTLLRVEHTNKILSGSIQ